MKVEGTNLTANSETASSDKNSLVVGGSSVMLDPETEPFNNSILEDDGEVLVIPQISSVRSLVIPLDILDEMPPSLADRVPIQTTIEDGELVHTPLLSDELLAFSGVDPSFDTADSLLNTTYSDGSAVMLDPEIEPFNNSILEDDGEVLVIPQISSVRSLVIPLDILDEMPPSLADRVPIQTTIEDGELVHTPLFPELVVEG